MPILARAPHLCVVTLQASSGAMHTGEDLNELAQALAATGDRRAFAALFAHFAPRVKAYLMRSGSAESLAEELAQETLVRVWRKAASFDAERAGVSTWIFAIARNLRVDQHRREGIRVDAGAEDAVEDFADPAGSPEDQFSARQRERGVRAALTRLSAEQAQILRLSFFEEKPHARIASELCIPLGTVKSRIHQARKTIQPLLIVKL